MVILGHRTHQRAQPVVLVENNTMWIGYLDKNNHHIRADLRLGIHCYRKGLIVGKHISAVSSHAAMPN